MRKEIKRSLLVWPLMASAAVSSIGLFETIDWASTHRKLRPPIARVMLGAATAKSQVTTTIMSWKTSVGSVWNQGNTLGGWAGDPSTDGSAGAAFSVVQKPSEFAKSLLRPSRRAAMPAPVIDRRREVAGKTPRRNQTLRSERRPGSLDLSFLEREKERRRQQAEADLRAMDSLARLLLQQDSKPAFLTGPPAAESTTQAFASPRSVAVLGKYERVPEKVVPLSVIEEPAEASKEETLSLGSAADPGSSHAVVRPQEASPAKTIEVKAPSREVKTAQRPTTNPSGWPVATTLHRALEALKEQSQAAQSSAAEVAAGKWASEVIERLQTLEKAEWLGAPVVGPQLNGLVTFAKAGEAMAEDIDDRELQVAWLQASHALQRRLAVWGPIWKVVEAGARQSVGHSLEIYSSLANEDEAASHAKEILKQVELVRALLPESGDLIGWSRFLLLNDIVNLAEHGNREARAEVAQRFLSRLEWYGLNAEHKIWLNHETIRGLADSIQSWSVTPVDYARLVRQLERQEEDAIDLSAIEIADAVQSLRFSKSRPSVAVADAINTHYRNANLRFAISDDMLRRLLPPVDTKIEPVRTNLLGSRIVGTSRIQSQLDLRLVPSEDRWKLRLRTTGNVHTKSVGLNGPVAVRTMGRSAFASETPIELRTDQVRIGSSTVSVNNQNRLQGIQTDYDGLPLLGSLVRSVAASRYQDTSSISDRFTTNRIRRSVRREVDSEVEDKLAESTQRFSDVVIGPLGRLGLEPMVVDMKTTADRLMARYRLAGDWQMAAFTPRPRAPHGSLMSLQLHQSAINNTMEQLVPRDEPVSIAEVVASGMLRFGASGQDLPTDLPNDVMVQFASTRPVTVEVKDDYLWLTLRIMQLKREDQLDLKKFIVRAKYRGIADGTRALLVREGSLQISGPRMSMRQRLPLRAIFNKILDSDQPLPITAPKLQNHPAMSGLAMSQLELRDGWIAVALSQEDAPRMAMETLDSIRR